MISPQNSSTVQRLNRVRPAYEEPENKINWYANIPPPLPHLRISEHIPRNLKRLKPLSKAPGAVMQVSEIRGLSHRIPATTAATPAVSTEHHPYNYYLYAIQHLDSLVQIIVQPLSDTQYQVIDTAYHLLYTVNAEFQGICCGRDGPEVEFKALNSHQQHVVTITRHNGRACPSNRLGNIEVKLEPDVPIGTVEADDDEKTAVKNISGDVLCHIKVENPKTCCHAPVYQVIPSRRGEDLGRIEDHNGGLMLTFPWRSESTTRTLLMSACVLMLYDAEKAKQSKGTMH